MSEADPRTTFNIHEAKTHLSRLVERAHAGEEIIFAKAGKPYARLVPLAAEPRPPRQPGRYKHLLKDVPSDVWFEPLPQEEIDAWEGKFSGKP